MNIIVVVDHVMDSDRDEVGVSRGRLGLEDGVGGWGTN